MPADTLVAMSVIEICTAFNEPVNIEVGRLSAPAELMIGTDSNAQSVDRYQVSNDLLYSVDTNLFLTVIVPSGFPTQGFGRVLVYLN